MKDKLIRKIPREVLDRIRILAAIDGMSANKWIVALLNKEAKKDCNTCK